MKNVINFRIIPFVCLLILSGCARLAIRETSIIRISGSDTMLILAGRWAEAYMLENPAVSIYTAGGGTEQGVQALIDGRVDICAASRPLKPNEARRLAEKYGKLGMSFLVAKDALSVYLNPRNPVVNLTAAQLKKIFTGEITNWRELGGAGQVIQVVLRPPNSGTHLYFQEHILEGEAYLANARTLPTTRSIIDFITRQENAIGYGGLGFGADIVHCKINQIEPTDVNVQNDTYPIIRYLYLYTIDTPRGDTKKFIDWILQAGQKQVKQTGYIPLWDIE
jgi:phosphate transport system substrate-binding protein